MLWGRKKRNSDGIALMLDAPNMLRTEFGHPFMLVDLLKEIRARGKIIVARVYINQHASKGLMEAIVNLGYECILCVGDPDVRIAVDATELLNNDNIGQLVIATRDSDFVPIFTAWKRQGKKTIVFIVEKYVSAALKNAVDEIIVLGNDKE